MLLIYRTLFYYNPCNTYFHHDIFKYQEVMKLVYLLNDSCLIIVYWIEGIDEEMLDA